MKQTGDLYLLYVLNQYGEHYYIVFNTTSSTTTMWYDSLDQLISDSTFYQVDTDLTLDTILANYTTQNSTFFLTPIRSIDTILTDFPELVI